MHGSTESNCPLSGGYYCNDDGAWVVDQWPDDADYAYEAGAGGPWTETLHAGEVDSASGMRSDSGVRAYGGAAGAPSSPRACPPAAAEASLTPVPEGMFIAPDGLAYPKATPAEVTVGMGPMVAAALSWLPAVIQTKTGGGARAACGADATGEAATLEGPAAGQAGDTSQGTSGQGATVGPNQVLASGNELKNGFHKLVGRFHVKLGTSTCKGGMPVASDGMHNRAGGDSAKARVQPRFERKLVCVNHEAPTQHGCGTNCKWAVSYKLVDAGVWALCAGSPSARGEVGDHTFSGHNHPLFSTALEARASGSGAHVPDEYDQMAQLLAASGQTTAQLRVVLETKWKREHDNDLDSHPYPWGDGGQAYKLLYDRYCATGPSLEFDFEGLMDVLKVRQQEQGLHFMIDHDQTTMRMNRLYVELQGAAEEWAPGGKQNSLLFDPTWGTNLYRWKLCMIATLSRTGQTVLLGYALLEDESALSFEWVFRCVHKCLREPPSVVFTDHDMQIERALQKCNDEWPETRHFLCIFHLSKNLYTHLRPKFLGDGGSERWKAVHDLFWKIVKNTDVSYQARFADEWEGLVALVESTATNTDKLQEGLAWLRSLGLLASRFAYCYTWGSCTWGIHSTQRIEGMQNVAKTNVGLNARCKLLELHTKLQDYNRDKRRAIAVQEVRTLLRHVAVRAVIPPILKALENRVSGFAYGLLVSQAEESVNYYSLPLEERSPGDDATDGDDSDALGGSTQAFRVLRVSAVPPAALEYDEHGAVRSYACPVDFGGPSPQAAAENPAAGRVVRLTCSGAAPSKKLLRATCSCQFGVSWGVGLCRHILHVACVLQVMEIDMTRLAVVGKWLNPERAPEPLLGSAPACAGTAVPAAAEAAAPLRQAREHSRDRPGGPIGQWGTDQKRKDHLVGVHSDVLSLGRKSDELCEHVHAGLLALTRSAAELDEANRAEQSGGVASARRAAQRVEELTPTLAPSSALPHFSRLTKTEQTAITSELALRWSIAPARPFGPSSAEEGGDGDGSCGGLDEVFGFQGSRQSELVGRHILCKFQQYDGGWWVGEVVRGFLGHSPLPEMGQTVHGSTYPVNFEVRYDDGPQYHALVMENCLNYQTEGVNNRAAVWDWFLLQPRELHNPGAHTTVRPAAAKGRGRASSEPRKAPVAGPTSRHRKRKAPTATATSTPSGLARSRAQPTPTASPGSAPNRRARK